MTQPTQQPDIPHRRIAVEAFNFVWTLLEKENRSRQDVDRMIHAAHTSRYHWEQVGTVVNLARGEWQCSRVYAVLAMGESAHYHARRCLDICEEHGIGDFDIAFAYEALARASAAAGRRAECTLYAALAEEAGASIEGKEDRDWFFEDFNKGNWFGARETESSDS